MYRSFHPGKLWLDTNGKPIHANGFSVSNERGKPEINAARLQVDSLTGPTRKNVRGEIAS